MTEKNVMSCPRCLGTRQQPHGSLCSSIEWFTCLACHYVWATASGVQCTVNTQARHARQILVVDDQASSRRLVQRGLPDYDVVIAFDGAHALGLARHLTPVLLITDYWMPSLTGPELAQRLRERQPDLPVLIITGDVEPHMSVSDPSWRWLAKPFTLNALRAAVAETIDGSRTRPFSQGLHSGEGPTEIRG